jgi:hypothetical protein
MVARTRDRPALSHPALSATIRSEALPMQARLVDSEFNESGTCPCCNTVSRSSSGVISSETGETCRYVVRWTKDDRTHPVGIFLVSDGIGITVEYRFAEKGFMIQDKERFEWPPGIQSHALTYLSRAEALKSKDREVWIYAILDLIWVGDPNIPR